MCDGAHKVRRPSGYRGRVDEPVATGVTRSVGNSSLAEVAWVAEDGTPRVRGVVALQRGGRPALAFTYADEVVARSLGAASRIVLALTEPRSTGSGFAPALLAGGPSLVEDPTGEVYLTDLVVQELHRYPPSRLFADSPLLMREHWWYLPRLVVELDVDTVQTVEPRLAPHDHLLVVADGTDPVVRLAGPGERAGDRLALDVHGAAPAPGRAVVFGQEATFPDLDQWAQWSWTGTWDGAGLVVAEDPAVIGLGPPPGLMRRWRRQRAFQRRCTEAIPRA